MTFGIWRQHRWLINGTQLVEGDELRSHNSRQFIFSYLPPISTLVHSWICYFQGRFTAQWPQELGPFSYTSSCDNSLLTHWLSSGISNPPQHKDEAARRMRKGGGDALVTYTVHSRETADLLILAAERSNLCNLRSYMEIVLSAKGISDEIWNGFTYKWDD